MKLFKMYYSQESSTWLRHHPGQVIKLSNISEISGLYSFNSNIFNDDQFSPSLTTDIKIDIEESSTSETKIFQNATSLKVPELIDCITTRGNTLNLRSYFLGCNAEVRKTALSLETLLPAPILNVCIFLALETLEI